MFGQKTKKRLNRIEKQIDLLSENMGALLWFVKRNVETDEYLTLEYDEEANSNRYRRDKFNDHKTTKIDNLWEEIDRLRLEIYNLQCDANPNIKTFERYGMKCYIMSSDAYDGFHWRSCDTRMWNVVPRQDENLVKACRMFTDNEPIKQTKPTRAKQTKPKK